MQYSFSFSKYQGTGNDFILVQDAGSRFPVQDVAGIASLCHRHLGIGADGLILLQPSGISDFKMVYFNSDGRESTMCGNGGRCLAHFASRLGFGKDGKLVFEAIDGLHHAEVAGELVRLEMTDVTGWEITSEDDWIGSTGSPHFVKIKDIWNSPAFVEEARAIRQSSRFCKDGINVNFMERNADGIRVRTFERGVENETLSCGTGVVASAVSAVLKWQLTSPVKVQTRGGNLLVHFQQITPRHFSHIVLEGPAVEVFTGNWNAHE